MEILSSNLRAGSSEFKANAGFHRALAQELKDRLALARQGGGEKYRQRQQAQGKIVGGAQRIDRLLDPGSPFLELSAAGGGLGMYEDPPDAQGRAWSPASGGWRGAK